MHALLLFAAAHGPTLAPLTAAQIFPLLFILILAGFLGYEVIGRVSPTLHTPLMAATNAISGISLVGSLVAAGGPYSGTSHILGMVAVCAASINVVGGFMITDRMLRMFKKPVRQAQGGQPPPAPKEEKS